MSWDGLVPFLKNELVFFFTTKTPSTPRSYEYKGHQHPWRSPRLGGEIQDYLLEMAIVVIGRKDINI
jgi:hypothetical protein